MTNHKALPEARETIYIKIKIPRAVHEAMNKLWQIRKQIEGSDLRLWRLYEESGEQYINAKPQQQLLKEWANDRAGKAVKPPGVRAAARV